jgi:hypothetical protein
MKHILVGLLHHQYSAQRNEQAAEKKEIKYFS